MAKRKSALKLTEKQKEYDKQAKALEQKLKNKAKSINKRGYTIPEELFPEKPKKRLKSYLEKLAERIENIYDYIYYVNPKTGEYSTGTQRRGAERRKAAEKAAQTRHEKQQIQEIDKFNREYEEFREKYRDQIESDEYFDFNVRDESPFAKPPKKKKRKPDYRDATPEDYETLPQEAVIIFDRIYAEIEKWQPDPRWSSQLSEIKREDTNQLRSIIDGAVTELGREQVIRNMADHAVEFEALCMEVMYVSGSNMRETGREGIRQDLAYISEWVWGRPLTVWESQILERQSEMYMDYE